MSVPDLVVRNALWMGDLVDVMVQEGHILGVAPSMPDADRHGGHTLDAKGLMLLPSCVDAHVHLREPGFEYKEDIASGLRAAAHGGIGHVMAMANTSPVNDDSSVTDLMLGQARKHHPHGPFLHPIGALTRDLKGEQLAPMAELAKAGCVAFSNDGQPVLNSEYFRRAMEYADTIGKVVIDHCEDPFMAPAAGMNEGAVSSRLGLRGQPWASEAAQVARDILLAEYLGIPIHLAHISCIGSLNLIREAKARGVKVTAETCPHYLFLTEEAVEGYNTAAKVNPPLRTRADLEAMREAIKDGTIDILATDHAPHASHEKEVEFQDAPCGISGLDTALSQTYSLVRDGLLDMQRFVELWCYAPADIFGLRVCHFLPGDPAEFCLFDPDAKWTVSPETMCSKGKNTPLLGHELQGRVVHHYMSGVEVLNK
ncbi:MAG: dihydroorotase [Desulfovibrio sp.]|uniref:dihydroorotase n=1 Tax=Desulfovibrio sp. 7SRBS1 TaxID=3378064 RepID=UPI003B413E47